MAPIRCCISSDDVNIMDDGSIIIERSGGVLLKPCKDIGLSVIIGKTKFAWK
jgi:hypothetical protein